jgi:hypothetical protein
MAGSRNFYDETDKFFSDDKRSRLFVALNYKGTNFGTSLNTKEYPNTLLNEAIFQLMSKQNHKPEDNQQPNPEKDRMTLAKDFEDFIHKLGKAHAEFDPHLSKGTGRENLDKLKWVYGNWSSMTMEGREFYTTFLNLVSSDGGMAANDPKASPHTSQRYIMSKSFPICVFKWILAAAKSSKQLDLALLGNQERRDSTQPRDAHDEITFFLLMLGACQDHH